MLMSNLYKKNVTTTSFRKINEIRSGSYWRQLGNSQEDGDCVFDTDRPGVLKWVMLGWSRGLSSHTFTF